MVAKVWPSKSQLVFLVCFCYFVVVSFWFGFFFVCLFGFLFLFLFFFPPLSFSLFVFIWLGFFRLFDAVLGFFYDINWNTFFEYGLLMKVEIQSNSGFCQPFGKKKFKSAFLFSTCKQTTENVFSTNETKLHTSMILAEKNPQNKICFLSVSFRSHCTDCPEPSFWFCFHWCEWKPLTSQPSTWRLLRNYTPPQGRKMCLWDRIMDIHHYGNCSI